MLANEGDILFGKRVAAQFFDEVLKSYPIPSGQDDTAPHWGAAPVSAVLKHSK
jgi:hypothetical protein